MKPTLVEVTDPWLEADRQGNRLITSLEGENPSGSIKDHMVEGELGALLAEGRLSPGSWVSEVSAGSTARSLTHYCAALGLKCALFVPDFLPGEQLADLREHAEVHAVNPAVGFELYERFCAERRTYPFNQFGDESKSRYYVPLGAELRQALGPLDAVVGAVGTGHSLVGIARGAGARSVTAEPRAGSVHGIRNIDLQRNGPKDPCVPAWFDERIVLPEDDYFPNRPVQTRDGAIAIYDSFRVVLGAARAFLRGKAGQRVFLIGAANRWERPAHPDAAAPA